MFSFNNIESVDLIIDLTWDADSWNFPVFDSKVNEEVFVIMLY